MKVSCGAVTRPLTQNLTLFVALRLNLMLSPLFTGRFSPDRMSSTAHVRPLMVNGPLVLFQSVSASLSIWFVVLKALCPISQTRSAPVISVTVAQIFCSQIQRLTAAPSAVVNHPCCHRVRLAEARCHPLRCSTCSCRLSSLWMSTLRTRVRSCRLQMTVCYRRRCHSPHLHHRWSRALPGPHSSPPIQCLEWVGALGHVLWWSVRAQSKIYREEAPLKPLSFACLVVL